SLRAKPSSAETPLRAPSSASQCSEQQVTMSNDETLSVQAAEVGQPADDAREAHEADDVQSFLIPPSSIVSGGMETNCPDSKLPLRMSSGPCSGLTNIEKEKATPTGARRMMPNTSPRCLANPSRFMITPPTALKRFSAV